MSLLAAVLVAVGTLVWRPPWFWVRVRLDGVRRPAPGRRTAATLLAIVFAASVLLLPPAPTIVVWSGLGIAVTAWHRSSRSRRRRAAFAVRDETHVIVDALVNELGAGTPPSAAVRRLAGETRLLSAAAVAAGAGGDVGAALVAAGREDGARVLDDVGRAWSISEACGAPLVDVLEHVRETARDDRESHRELVSGIAPARATTGLMVAMPPLGLALGSGLGVDPLAVVLTTVPGALCLATGIGFAVAGVLWIDAVADRIESTP